MGNEIVVIMSTGGQLNFQSSSFREVNLSQKLRSISGEIGWKFIFATGFVVVATGALVVPAGAVVAAERCLKIKMKWIHILKYYFSSISYKKHI